MFALESDNQPVKKGRYFRRQKNEKRNRRFFPFALTRMVYNVTLSRKKKSSSPRAATGGRLDWLIVNHQSGQHVCSSSGTQLRGTTYPSFNRGVFERKDFGVRVVISRTDQKTKKKKNLAEAEKMCSKEKKKNFFKRLLRGGTGFSFDFPF